MNYAIEDERFIAAVNEYVHKRIGQLNKFGDGLSDIEACFCARHDDAVIYDVFDECKTSNDRDEIRTRCNDASIRTVSEINTRTVSYYDDQRDAEMQRQIDILIDEAQRNGARRL